MKKLLPVVLDLENAPVLVVGGGAVAARKVAALLEVGARVRVIAPALSPDFPAPIEHHARRFQSGDCAGFRLVFAATDERAINAQVVSEARALGAWGNNASAPDASDFHTVATIRRGPIAVGISTGGASPVLARHVRARLENVVGEEYERLFALLDEFSSQIAAQARGPFWTRLLESEALAQLRAGNVAAARAVVAAILAA